MASVISAKFDRAVFWRHFWTGLAIALAVVGGAAHYIPVNVIETETVERASYGRMAADPLVVDDCDGLRHRVLMPLLAWVMRFSCVEVNAAFFVVFVAMVYAWLVTVTGMRVVGALFVVALANTSFFSTFLIWPIFPDPVSYVLLMFALVYVDRPLLWPLFYGLTLFNHEMGIFSFLFFMLLQIERGYGSVALLKSAQVVVAMIIAYLLFRMLLKMHFIDDVSCGVNYYFNLDRFVRALKDNFFSHMWWKAFLYSYKFILMLPAMAWALSRPGDGARRLIAFPLAESVLFMVVASDLSRLANHAFLTFLVATAVVASAWGRVRMSLFLAAVFGLNFLIRSHVYWGIGW